MAEGSARPLSDLVAQGWEIVQYTSGRETHSGELEKFLLRRQRAHKLLIIRRKMLGGFSVKEVEL